MSLSNSEICQQLRRNLYTVQRQVAEALAQATPTVGQAQPQLVAVTKYTPLEVVRELVELGQRVLGENRPQQLIKRAEQIPAEWHLIGQLQSNKVRAVLPHVAMIHSVDSLKLLKRIIRIGDEIGCHPPLLLQVNISGESAKSGFTTDEVNAEWSEICEVGGKQVCGFMTMAPLTADEKVIRATFRGLRQLRDDLQAISPQMSLPQLSMGMSGDFPIAIAEGATLIRVGSSLFAGTS